MQWLTDKPKVPTLQRFGALVLPYVFNPMEIWMPNSYAPQVSTDTSGKFYGNALRFATKAEAEANVHDLMMRWFMVIDTRVVESDDPPNYRWTDDGIARIGSDEPPVMPAKSVTL